MANIIASGTTEADSSEFTLTATDAAVLSITGGAGPNALAHVKVKGSDSTFSTIGYLSKQYPAMTLSGAGTYKVTRAAAAVAFGVDKN